MASTKRPRPKRYAIAAQELKGYFAGELQPEAWDQIPFSLREVEPSIVRARTAVNAHFPDLMQRPNSQADACGLIKKCVEWAEQLAQAFNADPQSTLPFGLQSHVRSVPQTQWTSAFLGVLPSHLAYRVKPYRYSCYLEQRGDEPDYLEGYRADLLGYWSQIAKDLFWQHRADRAACRRILRWTTTALIEFQKEEVPAIRYLKPLEGDLHLVEVEICGVAMPVKLQDKLTKLLLKLSTGAAVALEHRTSKQRLIDKIPSLSKYLEPADPKNGKKRAATGSCYVLSKTLLGRLDFSRYGRKLRLS
jgi:hypothetical protein